MCRNEVDSAPVVNSDSVSTSRIFGLEPGGNARAKAIALAGHRIGDRFVANRNFVGCTTQLIRLSPALVEAAEPYAGLDEESVDRFTACSSIVKPS